MSSLGQHLSQDFLKLNPHHTVPTYQDDKITLSESRAIMAYLVNRFASPENASLYPADPVKRGNIRSQILTAGFNYVAAFQLTATNLLRK